MARKPPIDNGYSAHRAELIVSDAEEPEQVLATPPSTRSYNDGPKRDVPPLKPKYQRKPTDPDDTPTEEEQKELDDAATRRATMENRVDERIRQAIAARSNSGIEEVWRESNELFEGVDALNNPGRFLKVASNAPKAGASTTGQSTLILNITAPKTNIAVSRVQEMLVPNDDKAFAVEPTPIPELDEDLENPETMVTLGDGTQAPAGMVALKAKDDAQKAAEEEEKWIDDQFVEGDGKGGTVYAEMRKVIADAGRIGSGVLKGPIVISDEKKKWVMSKGSMVLQAVKRMRPTSKKIRAEDLFPAPDCGDNLHNGSYCVERDYLTGRQLRDLAALEDDGYDRIAIGQALVEGPQTHARTRGADYARKEGDNSYDADLFEVWYYHGDCLPEDLESMGMSDDELSEEERALSAVPAVVTMLNGRAIKCVVNPNERGAFPYDVFVWDPVDGQVFGRGVPWKGRTAQRMLTASVRKMMENGGMSAGPQVVTTRGAIEPWDNDYSITGRKGWHFEANEFVNDVQKAFAVFSIPSMQEELMNIVRFALEMFDQLLNLPLLMQGIQQADTSPETLGGMKMLYQNSTSPLRTTAKQFDDRIIVPHLTRYHDWGMSYGPANIKGDNKIKARGATVLVKLEEAREYLMMLYQVKDDPAFRINPTKFAAAMSKANGFDLSTIQYTEDEWKEQEAKMAQQPPPKDPRVEAAEIRTQAVVEQAKIRSQDTQAEIAFKQGQAEQDRQHQIVLHNFAERLEVMRLSGQENISIAEIKAQLAIEARKSQLTTDEMQIKLKTGQGI